MGYTIQQSTTAHPLLFLLVQSSDHITPLTGAVPVVTISKDGAAFASPAGTVSEIANGWYKCAGNATDNSTLGALLLHATAASGDPCDEQYRVVAYNPDDGVHLGITALPNAAAGAAGGLDTPIAQAGTAQAGAAGTITLSAGASATDNYYRGATVELLGGTGAGQSRVITGYVGSTKVATVGRNWVANPDSTSVYGVRSDVMAVVNDSLQVVASSVAGNVTGSVASVTAGVTVTTNNDKVGYALTSGEHTAISGTDVPAGLTAQGYTTTRAGYLDTLSGLVQAIWDKATSALTTVGSIGKLLVTNLDAAISSRLATGGYTAPDNADIATILTRVDVATSTRASATDYTTARAAKLDNLDAAVSTRMATFTYSAPPSTSAIAAAILLTPAHLLATDVSGNVAANNLPSDYQQRAVAVTLPGAPGGVYDAPAALAAQGVTSARLGHLDADMSSRLATSSYTAPDNADIVSALADLVSLLARTDPTSALGAIQTVTDQMRFTVANQVDANTLDKTGYALANTGLDSILPVDPTVASDANRTANLRVMLTCIYLALYAKVTTTAAPGVETIYNRAGVAIGTLTTTDDGTTFTRLGAA